MGTQCHKCVKQVSKGKRPITGSISGDESNFPSSEEIPNSSSGQKKARGPSRLNVIVVGSK